MDATLAALRAGVCVSEKDRPKALHLMDAKRGNSGQIHLPSCIVMGLCTTYYNKKVTTDSVEQGSSASALLTFGARIILGGGHLSVHPKVCSNISGFYLLDAR